MRTRKAGTLIIGIKERKEGKNSRVADCIDDGIDGSLIGREQLQQLIESNVYPYLPSMRVTKIPLTEYGSGRCVFVIEIPQGNTAYQAWDCCYYGTSELQVRPLQGHEIRIRMMRTQNALARLQLSGVSLIARRALNPKYIKNASFYGRNGFRCIPMAILIRLRQ